MFHKLARMRSWLATLLVVVVIGAASAASISCGGGASESSAAAGNQTQVATVRYGNLTSEISAGGSLGYGTTEKLSFDAAGELQDVYVKKDDIVAKGAVLARLASTEVIILQLEEDVARAKVNLKNAKEALDDVLTPYEEADIADARVAVQRANTTLANTKAQGDFDIAAAQWALDQAEEKRTDAVNHYMGGAIDLEEMQKAWTDWEAAVLQVKVAKQKSEDDIYDAQRALEKAQDKLNDMLEAPDPEDVDLKQRQIATAQGKLEDAQDELMKAREGYPLVAPFDGVVVAVNADVQPGDDVNANTVILEVADTSVIEMSGTVDEVDVANVKLGQHATVTLDALPDIELSGNVTGISAFAQSQSGVVSYPVTISLTIPSGTRLLEGMSATASISIDLATNALLVPNGAIVGPADRPVVMVLVDGQPQPRMVTVGATDGVRTEVVTGLKEGDVVVVSVATGSSSPSQTPRGFRPPGGFIMEGGPPEGGGVVIRQ